MTSPVPQKIAPDLLTFPQALNKVIDGKKITRIEWNDSDEYFTLVGEYLMVHHSADKKLYQLMLREADLLAIDWIVI